MAKKYKFKIGDRVHYKCSRYGDEGIATVISRDKEPTFKKGLGDELSNWYELESKESPVGSFEEFELTLDNSQLIQSYFED